VEKSLFRNFFGSVTETGDTRSPLEALGEQGVLIDRGRLGTGKRALGKFHCFRLSEGCSAATVLDDEGDNRRRRDRCEDAVFSICEGGEVDDGSAISIIESSGLRKSR
jgi:hypothetical protein